MSTVVKVSRDQAIRIFNQIQKGTIFNLGFYHIGKGKVDNRLGRKMIPPQRKDLTRKVSNDVLRFNDVAKFATLGKKKSIIGPRKDKVRWFKTGGITYKIVDNE